MAKKATKKKVTKKVVEKSANPRFVYVGDPRGFESPLQTQHWGMTFELNGDPVEVTDPLQITKLRNNNHFKEV